MKQACKLICNKRENTVSSVGFLSIPYYLIHISQHIPQSEAEKLEFYAKISSLEDIAEKTQSAEGWFIDLMQTIEGINNKSENKGGKNDIL